MLVLPDRGTSGATAPWAPQSPVAHPSLGRVGALRGADARAAVAMVWRSSNLANYYFGGVSRAEATAQRPYYDVWRTTGPNGALYEIHARHPPWWRPPTTPTTSVPCGVCSSHGAPLVPST